MREDDHPDIPPYPESPAPVRQRRRVFGRRRAQGNPYAGEGGGVPAEAAEHDAAYDWPADADGHAANGHPHDAHYAAPDAEATYEGVDDWHAAADTRHHDDHLAPAGPDLNEPGPEQAALLAHTHPAAPTDLEAVPSEQDGDRSGPPPPLTDVFAELEPEQPRRKPRLKKLRFALILFASLVLGSVSFVFGMFMAVTQDLPALENYAQYNNAQNSTLIDDQGRFLGVLSEQHKILLKPGQVPQIVKEAVISVEDKRFYSNNGIDLRGIARAFIQDVVKNKPVQGASTIEQQFVKNALSAQAHRTIFEKLREAALAYHLARKWSKEKIITEYLNTIYFGNGAYGVESAARTYFGNDPNHAGCGTIRPLRLCVSELKPYEAALLAGMMASPTAYDPTQHPVAAKHRRDLVLKDMLDQGYITPAEYSQYITEAMPAKQDIQPPQQRQVDNLQTGYFTDWVRQQLIDRYGAQRALEGGLVVRTTLDVDLQRAAEQAINNYLADPNGPSASMVVIDNATGDVRAMVGGRDYTSTPFNLATEGERQPGSAFKVFDLAAALEKGVSPDSVWSSRVKTFVVPHSGGQEHFVVHNDNNNYSGSISLTDATAYSDNSVFAELGIDTGTRRIAQVAHTMGIRTPLSTNPAMTIGGLKTGVTALDMAHAYETIAHGGQRVGGTLVCQPESSTVFGSTCLPGGGPVGIETVTSGSHVDVDTPVLTRVLPSDVASTETSMLQGVIEYGTAKAAAIGQFAAGKTGTTSNYGDAWFVGWNDKYTVAVWVGYPDSLKPMLTEFSGGPVLGGTFPALIWHDFMTAAIQIDQNRAAAAAAARAQNGQGATGAAGASGGGSSAGPATTSGSGSPGSQGGSSGGGNGGNGAGVGGNGGNPNANGGNANGGNGGGGNGGGGNGAAGGGGGGGGGSGGGGSSGGGSGGGGSGGGGGGGSAPTSSPSPPASPAPSSGSSPAPSGSGSAPSGGAGASGGASAPTN